MVRLWLGSFASVMAVLACRVDTSGVGDGSAGHTDTGSTSTGATSNPTTSATTDASADGTSTGVGETGPADTGPADTGPGDTGSEATTTDPETSGTSATSGDSSSGELPDDSYPPCMEDDDCVAPYTLCWPSVDYGTPNFCTHECGDADECPVPTSGDATPSCEGPPQIDVCVLDCSVGECPGDMTCTDVFGDGNFMRCTRS